MPVIFFNFPGKSKLPKGLKGLKDESVGIVFQKKPSDLVAKTEAAGQVPPRRQWCSKKSPKNGMFFLAMAMTQEPIDCTENLWIYSLNMVSIWIIYG